MDSYFVYILASKRNGTLYTGSTTDLIKRVWQHKNKVVPCFTEKYNQFQFTMKYINNMLKLPDVKNDLKTGVDNGKLT